MSEKEFSVKSYRDFLSEGQIKGSRCGDCGAISLPPRPICPECGGSDPKWTEMEGVGTIQTYTVIHVPLTRTKNRAPYALGIVKLDAGPSISGIILDVTEEKITVGSRVEAEFVQEGERTALCFRPI